MHGSAAPPRLLGLALLLVLLPRPAAAVQVDDPVNFSVDQTWSGLDLGVPGRLGALRFSEDGLTAYLVGDSEASTSAVYALPVIREPSTERVLDFGPAVLVFSGDPTTPGIDAGMELGPEGTLFYTYYSAHRLGERTATATAVEVQFPMGPTGVPTSVAGLTFSPHLTDPGSNFGQLQVSSWAGDGIYNVPLIPQGGGVYAPGTAELFVRLPQQGTGAIQYVPQGQFTGNLMYVNWNFGEVRMLMIDQASGLPIDDLSGLPTLGTTTPRDIRFAYEIGVGPWGLEFDPLSQDFFVTTWNGSPSNSIIQFTGQGFANQAPVAFSQTATTPAETPIAITLLATDPDLDTLSYAIGQGPAHGTVTGTTATLVYTPSPGFAGEDFFTFIASDGQLSSNTATVSLHVEPGQQADAGLDPDVGQTDAVNADAEVNADAAANVDAEANVDAQPGQDAAGLADTGVVGDAGVVVGDPDTKEEGCGCRISTGAAGRPWGWALLALLMLRRRRRERGTSPTTAKY